MLNQVIFNNIQEKFEKIITAISIKDIVTVEIEPKNLVAFCSSVRDCSTLLFDELIDVCGVDYSHYGLDEWRTSDTANTGFSRGVGYFNKEASKRKERFSVVYHLLSLQKNSRLRIKVHVSENCHVPSLIRVWSSADWYEREVFDMFGIKFTGHPDLRRILTDYGFQGNPLRKDFPLVGKIAMRYDATLKRCIYEPVDIENRTLVPKVIRKDNRYLSL